jgi:hypothetical protein
MLVLAYLCLYLGVVVILTALVARFMAGTKPPVDENAELAEFFAEKKRYEAERYGSEWNSGNGNRSTQVHDALKKVL